MRLLLAWILFFKKNFFFFNFKFFFVFFFIFFVYLFLFFLGSSVSASFGYVSFATKLKIFFLLITKRLLTFRFSSASISMRLLLAWILFFKKNFFFLKFKLIFVFFCRFVDNDSNSF